MLSTCGFFKIKKNKSIVQPKTLAKIIFNASPILDLRYREA